MPKLYRCKKCGLPYSLSGPEAKCSCLDCGGDLVCEGYDSNIDFTYGYKYQCKRSHISTCTQDISKCILCGEVAPPPKESFNFNKKLKVESEKKRKITLEKRENLKEKKDKKEKEEIKEIEEEEIKEIKKEELEEIKKEDSEFPFSVGFEFESTNWQIKDYTEDNKVILEKKRVALPSKSRVFSEQGVHIETDSDHIEFVFDPSYDMKTLKTQMYVFYHIHQVLLTNKETIVKLKNDVLDDESKVWAKAGEQVIIIRKGTQENPIATCQSSLGIPISCLLKLLEAKPMLPKYKDLSGFLAIINYYIANLFTGKMITNSDGPKACLKYMMRTDFVSMYKSLTKKEQEEFEKLRKNLEIEIQEKEMKVNKLGSIKVKDWLVSISNPLLVKDKLSPPPGYPEHKTKQRIPYAMGVIELDPNNSNVVLEYRIFGQHSCERFLKAVLEWVEKIKDYGGKWDEIPEDILSEKNLVSCDFIKLDLKKRGAYKNNQNLKLREFLFKK